MQEAIVYIQQESDPPRLKEEYISKEIGKSWLLANVNGTHVHVRYMLSPVHLLSVCNARVPYSGGWNFPQYFYGIWYLGHPLTSI